MQRLVSEYSNQLHQLLVSVSRHLYFASDGYIRYQEKPMEVNISNCSKSRREHLVYYILRDHFSGTFALRIATTKRLVPLADFLYYAWSKDVGEDKFIWGIPDTILIPRIIDLEGLATGLNQLNVDVLHPSSGFASGIRVIRDIEENLLYFLSKTVDHSLEGLNKLRFKLYNYLISSPYRENNYAKWQNNLPPIGHPRTVPPYPDFIRLFATGNLENSSGFLVVGQEQQNQGLPQNMQNQKKKKAPFDYPAFSRKKLDRAQDLVYDAWEEPNWQKRLALARKALTISPYCADAYNLLAENSASNKERQSLYEQGVKVGRMALGDLFFKKYAGHFWLELETRPFMRSLAGWSECLWKSGQRQDAILNYKEILRLNPNDNQGIRYALINCLLEEELDEEAARLLTEYEESSCFMLYSQALLTFRRQGRNEAGEHLRQALAANAYVPHYLLGLTCRPHFLPDMYAWGSEEEAVIYASGASQVWENTPGALTWLADELEHYTP